MNPSIEWCKECEYRHTGLLGDKAILVPLRLSLPYDCECTCHIGEPA